MTALLTTYLKYYQEFTLPPIVGEGIQCYCNYRGSWGRVKSFSVIVTIVGEGEITQCYCNYRGGGLFLSTAIVVVVSNYTKPTRLLFIVFFDSSVPRLLADSSSQLVR